MLKLATKCAPEFDRLETAYRAGFRHVELWLDNALLEDWQAVLQRALHYPTRYVLHFPNRAELTAAGLRGCIELYRGLACRAMVIHQPMFERYGHELIRLEPELRLALENSDFTAARFEAWAEQSPHLTLDVEHLWLFTRRGIPLTELLAELRQFLKRAGHKLRHVHLPGFWPGCREHRPMYCGRDLVFPVLSLLAEHGFDGFVVSEVSPDFQNLIELQMDVLLFEAWRQRHEVPLTTP
jgi:sugar phosphate isomerase/epimerase